MSLLLRKRCQPLLDEELASYHVDIDDNKNMTIVSECGKPLFSITGITFTRTNPAKEEINYAAELLEEFLLLHNESICYAMYCKGRYFRAEKPKPTVDESFQFNTLYAYKEYDGGDGSITVKWFVDGTVSLSGCTARGYAVQPEFLNDLKDKRLQKKIQADLEKLNQYHDLKVDFDKAVSELQSCDI